MEKPKTAAHKPMIMDMKAGTYYWCACGASNKQPFCDGSHKDSDFTPLKIILNEDQKVAWCMCKRTKNKAFCDGSHNKIEE